MSICALPPASPSTPSASSSCWPRCINLPPEYASLLQRRRNAARGGFVHQPRRTPPPCLSTSWRTPNCSASICRSGASLRPLRAFSANRKLLPPARTVRRAGPRRPPLLPRAVAAAAAGPGSGAGKARRRDSSCAPRLEPSSVQPHPGQPVPPAPSWSYGRSKGSAIISLRSLAAS